MLSWDDFNQEEVLNRSPESKIEQESTEVQNSQQTENQKQKISQKNTYTIKQWPINSAIKT